MDFDSLGDLDRMIGEAISKESRVVDDYLFSDWGERLEETEGRQEEPEKKRGRPRKKIEEDNFICKINLNSISNRLDEALIRIRKY